jgi:hypothetical protein
MKSFILGFSTLLAVATTPAAAHAQVQYGDPAAVAPSGDQGWNQDGVYQPPAQPEAMAQQPSTFGFFGGHPVPYDQGGGFCQYSGAHEHPYPVFDTHLFRVVNGYAYFIGDPSDFGYQNQAYAYRADHPIDTSFGGGFCYMSWAHRHAFAPVSVGFSWDGGAYAYTGGWSPAYYADRPLYVNYYNSYYRNWYLNGGYYSRRPSPVYGGWGWHRPVYGSPWNRAGGVYNRPWSRPGYVTPPVYRAPGQVYRAPGQVYRAPGQVYRAPGQVYRAPGQVYRAPAPMYRQSAPVYRAPAPMYRQSAPVYRAPAQAYQASAPGYRSAPAFQGGGRFRR